jgi:hypothetical protein
MKWSILYQTVRQSYHNTSAARVINLKVFISNMKIHEKMLYKIRKPNSKSLGIKDTHLENISRAQKFQKQGDVLIIYLSLLYCSPDLSIRIVNCMQVDIGLSSIEKIDQV